MGLVIIVIQRLVTFLESPQTYNEVSPGDNGEEANSSVSTTYSGMRGWEVCNPCLLCSILTEIRTNLSYGIELV